MVRSSSCRRSKATGPLFAFALLPLIAVSAHAASLPIGGKVVAGSASIGAPTRGALTIDQTSKAAIIDWSGFSIGSGNSVTFDNGSGATLNRVTGTGVSSLNGMLNATGSVFVINADGVVVGRTGIIKTGGSFVASTLDLTNANFLTGGDLNFTGKSTAAVANLGKVGSLGGNVALIAATVSNAGSLQAAKGTAGLISGYKVTLRDADHDGNGLFTVQIGGKGTSVTNSGLIAAANAELRAEGGNVYALAGNTAGVIRATGVKATDGHVWLIADGGTLDVAGSIEAKGANGAAGAIETSGGTVSLGKAAIDAHGGTWLLDPDNLEITKAAASTISAALATSDVTEETTANSFTDDSGQGVVTPGPGDITVDPGASIAWTSSHTLNLQAFNNLILGGSISLSTGTLDLTAGGSIAVNAPISVTNAGTLNLTAATQSVGGKSLVDLSFAPGASINYGATDNGGALNINGAAYTLVYSLGAFPEIGGDGFVALATGLVAPTTAYSGPLTGNFNGVFEGLGNTITRLTITANNGDVGLFGSVGSSGVIRDLGLVGGSVKGSTINTHTVGDLVGSNNGVIANVYATGNVSGPTGGFVGGLAGYNGGAITLSFATGAVIGGASGTESTTEVGGLVGDNEGSINQSYATGAVSGGDRTDVGGLVGSDTGAIEGSHATGAVSAGSGEFTCVGGLVGVIGQVDAGTFGTGSVSASYAIGSVSGGLSSVSGGLVGNNNGSVSGSYATGKVGGDAAASGGLVGSNDVGEISDAYATGAVTGNGLVGGLAGSNGGQISRAYATGAVIASGAESFGGGLVGGSGTGGTITDGYYDAGTTGQLLGTQANGSVGLSTPTLQAKLPSGFSASVWGQIPGVSYPYLLGQFAPGTTPQVIAGVARNATVGGVLGVPIEAAVVDAAVDGSTPVGTVTTGANGYYYFLLAPGSFDAGSSVLTWLASGPAHANAVAEDPALPDLKAMNLYQSVLTVQTPDASLSGTEAGLASALGTATSGPGILFSVPGGMLTLGTNDSLEITTTAASFAVDDSLSLGAGLFKLTAAGSVDQTSGTITAGSLQGASLGGASFDAGNQIGKLAGWTDASGAFSLDDGKALSVSGVVSADGGIGIATTVGNLSLSRGLTAKHGDITLASAGNVVEAAALAEIDASGELSIGSVTGERLLAANTVGEIALSNTGSGAASYKENGALVVASASAAGGGALSLTSAGEMNLNGALTAGKVTLTSGSGIEETGSAILTATNLVGTAGGAVTLTHANQITTLGAFTDTAGSFSLTNAQALKQVGTLNGTGQVVTLTATSGNIAIDGTVSASTLTLNAKAGQLTESGTLGAIVVGTLNATANTGITLTSSHNAIGAIGTNHTNSGPDQITQ